MQHTCMNVTLYGWTFNFHKVVRQQNSGAVEDFILPYSALYLRIQKWKNYWNPSTFAKVILKIKVAPFLMAHGVFLCEYCIYNLLSQFFTSRPPRLCKKFATHWHAHHTYYVATLPCKHKCPKNVNIKQSLAITSSVMGQFKEIPLLESLLVVNY